MILENLYLLTYLLATSIFSHLKPWQPPKPFFLNSTFFLQTLQKFQLSSSLYQILENEGAYFQSDKTRMHLLIFGVVVKCAMVHCKCFSGLWGVHRFSLQYLWKRAVTITEKPYTPQRESLCMLWGNPVIFTDCGEILQLSQGFTP